MKLSKGTVLLLASALASTTYAVENVEMSGSAKLWYQTNTTNKAGSADLFDQATAVGLVEVDLGAKGDIAEGLKVEMNGVVLDSLNLENEIVGNLSNATAGNEGSAGNALNTQSWVSVANLEYTTGNTKAKAGRMALDTPLLFTERWNAGYNTFEGGVVTNTDLPNTKLTAMYITGNNGTGINNAGSPGNGIKIPSTTVHNGSFYGFGTSIDDNGQSGTGPMWTGVTVHDGKEALFSLGAEIKPTNDLALNLWYYNISSIKDAHWADASYTLGGLFLGVQNSGVYGKTGTYGNGNAYESGDGMITAFKVGYTIDKLNFFGAYSFTDDDANAPIVANFSTNRKSQIYTQAIVQDGAIIGARDTTAWKVQGSYQFESWKLLAWVQNTQQDSAPATSSFRDSTEYDIVAVTKVGKHVDLKGIYMHREYDETTAGDDKFDFVRLIASVKF
jgi:hypothetical protein